MRPCYDMLKRLLLFSLLLIAAVPLLAADVPSPAHFLSYTIRDRFTPHHRVLAYLRELEQKSHLITIHQFGETYEGRPLVYALITSSKNRANLEAIRQAVAAINR